MDFDYRRRRRSSGNVPPPPPPPSSSSSPSSAASPRAAYMISAMQQQMLSSNAGSTARRSTAGPAGSRTGSVVVGSGRTINEEEEEEEEEEAKDHFHMMMMATTTNEQRRVGRQQQQQQQQQQQLQQQFRVVESKSESFTYDDDDNDNPNTNATNNNNNGITIPEQYLYDPMGAEPQLDNLRQLNHDTCTMEELMGAADEDVKLHSTRIRLALLKSMSASLSNANANANADANTSKQQQQQQQEERTRLKLRHERQDQHLQMIQQLQHEAKKILSTLEAPPSGKHMTQGEISRERLLRWKNVLELYAYCPDRAEMDLWGLLDKLCVGCSEEEELSEALSQAAQMCTSLVEATSLAVRDATEEAAEAEDAYQIRLEAHAILARRSCVQSEEIEEQFRTNGRAALKIGQQLELAEAKRRQCESAAVLIRRWWTMENLAEQEEISGETIEVNEEVRGVIPSSSCRMDPLFTRPENSLEAARALKALRTVVKNRGTGASSGLLDPQSARRFDLTNNLIQRTSAALEARLLNSFSEICSKGGTYDFSSPLAAKRSGRLDWVQLRELAEALMCFDSGRSLHKRYVQMVISSRFPELFRDKHRNGKGGDDSSSSSDDSDEDDAEAQEFDMDATRTQLSSLFHRVSEVCTAEFQLIAHVFSSTPPTSLAIGGTEAGDMVVAPTPIMDAVPLQVARALLQRVISDPKNGLQARINDLLASIDRRGDFDAGAKKLDTFVVIHEKAAGLFSLLREAAERMLLHGGRNEPVGAMAGGARGAVNAANAHAVSSLVQFLTSQEMALSSGHRRGYLNLELRLLHHECCAGLDRIGVKLLKPVKPKNVTSRRGGAGKDDKTGKASLAEYRAPIMPLDKESLKRGGFADLLNGPLKQSVLRQPLIHATDSLARARLMFGGGHDGAGGDAEATARVITAIYSQMCSFYGQSFLFPIIESLGEMLNTNPPSSPPQLPFDEDVPPHDLGVDGAFWVGIERIHSAAKAFDRELWAEGRVGSARVWEILVGTGSFTNLTLAKERRLRFFGDLEERGEAAMLRALDTLSTHIQWILVTGGESMLATGGTRILHHLTGQFGGPYAIPAGSSLEAPNSPSVKSLTYCLRAQFVHIQAALTPQSLSAFWTALSMRLYDILVARLLQHYYVSTVGAVILSRDVEALRSVAMLAGTDHSHWDNLRELLTLYMTPPDALKTMLVGPEGDVNSGKGLFARVGKDQSVVFMSRRVDYRYKTNQGPKKSGWAIELLDDLGVHDPTDGNVNIGLYAAERKT